MFHAPVVDIYVTGACNLGCRYCFGELDSKPGMKKSIFLQALDFAGHVNATAVEFCGGEPLLYKDILWAVDIVRQRGFRLILRTNGFYLARYRPLIASCFDSVGISLDGDAITNDVMRPIKGASDLTPEEKFQIPLREISALKAISPTIQVVLASVATRVNTNGLKALARILVDQHIPLDLWKVYQFLANNFRARQNSDEFSLSPRQFNKLVQELTAEVNGTFPLICRKSAEINGSCLVVNRDGDILVGSRRLGNVGEHRPENLCARLEEAGVEASILENKQLTYTGILDNESARA